MASEASARVIKVSVQFSGVSCHYTGNYTDTVAMVCKKLAPIMGRNYVLYHKESLLGPETLLAYLYINDGLIELKAFRSNGYDLTGICLGPSRTSSGAGVGMTARTRKGQFNLTIRKRGESLKFAHPIGDRRTSRL